MKTIIRGTNVDYNKNLRDYKRTAISICKDFHYTKVMPDCNEKIKRAVSEVEVARILHTCRDRMFQ